MGLGAATSATASPFQKTGAPRRGLITDVITASLAVFAFMFVSVVAVMGGWAPMIASASTSVIVGPHAGARRPPASHLRGPAVVAVAVNPLLFASVRCCLERSQTCWPEGRHGRWRTTTNAIMTAWHCGDSAHAIAGDVVFSEEPISQHVDDSAIGHFSIRVLSKGGSAGMNR